MTKYRYITGNRRIDYILPKLFGWGYLIAMLLTFAYDAVRYPVYVDTYCSGKECSVRDQATPLTGLKGIVSGVLWPLFWTWEIADRAFGTTPPQAAPSPEASTNA